MNRLIVLLAVLLSGSVLGQQQPVRYQVTGQLKNVGNQKVFLTLRSNAFGASAGRPRKPVDSCRAVAGRFSLQGQIPEADYYAILIEGKPHFRSFILDETPVHITGDADSLSKLIITGSRALIDRQVLAQRTNPIIGEQSRIDTKQRESEKAGDTTVLSHYRRAYQDLSRQLTEIRVEFIESHPASLVSLMELASLVDQLPKTQAILLWNRLDPGLLSHSVGRKLRDRLFGEKPPLYDKQPAPNLVFADGQGQAVSVQTFKGKVVLVDFWASWCAHCQTERKRLKVLYDRYKEKGFHIVSVSLDQDRTAWRKAVEKNGFPWTHLYGRSGYKKAVSEPYDGDALPINVLIDQEGNIVRKGLHGAALEEQLATLFDKR